MAKKHVLASEKLENRVMVSFSDHDYASLEKEAKAARLPVATYARILIARQLPLARALPLPRPRPVASRAKTA
jgi:hypothetical protein